MLCSKPKYICPFDVLEENFPPPLPPKSILLPTTKCQCGSCSKGYVSILELWQKGQEEFLRAPNGLGCSLMKLVGHWMVTICGQGIYTHLYITSYNLFSFPCDDLTTFDTQGSPCLLLIQVVTSVTRCSWVFWGRKNSSSCLSRVWVGAATLDSWLGMYLSRIKVIKRGRNWICIIAIQFVGKDHMTLLSSVYSFTWVLRI